MEHLWSPAGATSGNRWQMGHVRKPLKHADPQPVATHGNRFAAHGKEGVSGSSPEEGFEKVLHSGLFPRSTFCICSTTIGRGALSGASRIFMSEICRLGWQRPPHSYASRSPPSLNHRGSQPGGRRFKILPPYCEDAGSTVKVCPDFCLDRFAPEARLPKSTHSSPCGTAPVRAH